MSADKRIVEKLGSLVYDLERLDILLDNPASDMTLGEYEDKRKEIIESCAKSIEEMLGAETCEWCKDGETFDKQTVMMTNHGWQKIRHCPNCGRRIKEKAESASKR